MFVALARLIIGAPNGSAGAEITCETAAAPVSKIERARRIIDASVKTTARAAPNSKRPRNRHMGPFGKLFSFHSGLPARQETRPRVPDPPSSRSDDARGQHRSRWGPLSRQAHWD